MNFLKNTNSLSAEKEMERISALHRFNILDTSPEREFDDLTKLASTICQTPIALISLVDSNRQWFKSKVGLTSDELPRESSFCTHAIKNSKIFTISDASCDQLFADNPYVKGNPYIRFYAGVPLICEDGFALGTLCVIDNKPRKLNREQESALQVLACNVMAKIETRRKIAEFAVKLEREEKRATTAAIDSEKKYRDLVDKSLGLIYTHSPEGLILSVNPATVNTLGYSAEELVGRSIAEIIPLSVRSLFEDYLAKINANTEASGEIIVLTKKGERRIWQYKNTLQREGADEAYILGHAQDITEIKRAAEELKESRELFRAYIDNSPAVIYLKDQAGRLIFVNKMFENLFDVKAAELIGKTDFDFLPEEIASVVRIHDLQVIETGQPLQTVEFVPTPDGTPHYWLSHKFVVADEANNKLIGGVSFNITERQQMEEELSRSRDAALDSVRLKGEFLANMSHEIRTPLNGIIGVSELLEQTNLDDEQREYAETIRTSGSSLISIINDILDFSKIEAGMLTLEKVYFDARCVLDSVIRLFAETTKNKNIELSATVDKNLPTALTGDPFRLRQILTNLIGNAVKFTDKGKVTAKVELETETKTSATLRFSITDTGIGIPAKAQPHLFKAFTQAEGSITRRYGGTGLGLAICHQLVTLMGGDLQLKSQLNKGSTFSFTVEFEKQSEISNQNLLAENTALNGQSSFTENQAKGSAKSVAFHSILESEGSDGEKIKILVAEDNPVNQRVISRQLCKLGFVTDIVGNGKQALNLLEMNDYSLVLMDCQIPEMDGFAVTHEIRRRERENPGTSHLPIIALTAYATQDDHEKCLAAGMDDYISKPTTQTELLETLGRWMKKPQLETKLPPNPKLMKTCKSSNNDHDIAVRLSLIREECGAEMVGEFIDLFLVNTVERLTKLKELIDNNEVLYIKQEAHGLKGSSANMGATRIAKLCSRLEDEVETGNLEQTIQTFNNICSEFETAKAFFAVEREFC